MHLKKMLNRINVKFIVVLVIVIYIIHISFRETIVKTLFTDQKVPSEGFLRPVDKCEAIFGETKLSCDEYAMLKKNFQELRLGDKVEEKEVTLDDLVVVTAFSANHLHEAECHCATFATYPEFKNHKVKYIAYLMNDLTPSSGDLKNYKSKCPNFEFRVFNASKYLEAVKNLLHYSWKPLIVAEVLREYDLVYYVDSSVGMTDTAEPNFATLVDGLNKKNPWTQGVVMVHPAQHAIIGTTHPDMYKYLPLENATRLVEMQGATVFLMKKTQKSMSILSKWIACALIEKCISPAGSQLFCVSKKDWKHKEYGDCHRFDQSALNIILANTTNGALSSYANWTCIWTPDSDIKKYITKSTSCYVLRQC